MRPVCHSLGHVKIVCITKSKQSRKFFCLSCKIYSSALTRFCKRPNDLNVMSCRVQLCYHNVVLQNLKCTGQDNKTVTNLLI